MSIPYYKRNLYVLWFATFLVSASWTQVIPFLPLFLAELGVTENLDFWSGLAVSAHFVTGMIMMPIWGKLGDRYGRKPMLIRAGLSLSIIYFLTSLSTEAWHVVVARLANGALTGFIPMSISLVGTNTPPQYSARYVASVQTSSAIGTIVGPVIGGTLAGIFGVRGHCRRPQSSFSSLPFWPSSSCKSVASLSPASRRRWEPTFARRFACPSCCLFCSSA